MTLERGRRPSGASDASVRGWEGGVYAACTGGHVLPFAGVKVRDKESSSETPIADKLARDNSSGRISGQISGDQLPLLTSGS
ncbi:hypothetical protein SESBI_40205 [Sesbania bispinosa]|nr:hypothetical protein SESBI_40205 [Sesbania bispinosa]